jgi:transcriptional regulator with XRE-family HTH domain
VAIGLNRPQLADKLKFDRSYVYRVELGEIDPDLERMTAWLALLGPGASPRLFEGHRSIAKWGDFATEDQITSAVIEHWKIFGVAGSLVASIPNKRAFGQAGLTKGLPDLLVISPQLGRSAGFIEQKRGRRGKLSDAQIDIGKLLIERGVPYAIVRGRDEPIRVLEAWGAVRPAAKAA